MAETPRFNLSVSGDKSKELGKTMRGLAAELDPVGWLIAKFCWILIGGLIVAAMDYGDIWVCVGACDNNSSWSAD